MNDKIIHCSHCRAIKCEIFKYEFNIEIDVDDADNEQQKIEFVKKYAIEYFDLRTNERAIVDNKIKNCAHTCGKCINISLHYECLIPLDIQTYVDRKRKIIEDGVHRFENDLKHLVVVEVKVPVEHKENSAWAWIW